MQTLPKLFKKTSTGAIQQWEITVTDNVIMSVFGQVGGKLQTTTDTVKEGKSIGNKDETTPAQQAFLEAKSKWESQVKKGYVESITDAQNDKINDAFIEGGIFPMLAHKYSQHAHKIKYPAYTQPKLDGIRCIAVIENGVCTLWSRTRKLITGVPHINRELETKFTVGKVILDGELYNHKYKHDFETIVSFVRNEDPQPGHEVVQYHIYDNPTRPTSGFGNRFFSLEDEIVGMTYTRLVQTITVASEDELMDCYHKFCADGYEGSIVRNVSGDYKNKRSYDLQKVKDFDDAEFEIIGIEEGRGKLQGHAATFICKMDSGNTFNVKMKGDIDRLKEYFNDHSLWSGKKLTVQYQGLTNKNGVPRFPVGIAIRDYE